MVQSKGEKQIESFTFDRNAMNTLDYDWRYILRGLLYAMRREGKGRRIVLSATARLRQMGIEGTVDFS